METANTSPVQDAPAASRNRPVTVVHSIRKGSLAQVNFSANGNAGALCLEGWAQPELRSRRMAGTTSTLKLPRTAAKAGSIAFRVAPPLLVPRRLSLFIDGVLFADVEANRATWYMIPWPDRLDTTKSEFVLEIKQAIAAMPAGAAPAAVPAKPDPGIGFSDLTLLRWRPEYRQQWAPAVPPPQTDADRKKLALKFQSFGQNCELGLFQRKCGAEPLGPFRFAALHVDRLLRGLEVEFTDLGGDSLEIFMNPKNNQWTGRHKVYGLNYHTFKKGVLPTGFADQEHERMDYLARVLRDQLYGAEKIFVIQHRNLNLHQVLPVLRLIRSYNDKNRLMWVVPAQTPDLVGKVELLDRGFARAHIDRLAPEAHVPQLSLEGWLTVCATAAAALAA
jgi:hypothetical protein